jgi:hypothetical protein
MANINPDGILDEIIWPLGKKLEACLANAY